MTNWESLLRKSDKQWERKITIRELSVDPISNSLIQYHKNCIADSKENYKMRAGIFWWEKIIKKQEHSQSIML